MNGTHAATVVGFQHDVETPEAIMRGTSPDSMAQVEGWILTAVEKLAARYHMPAPFGHIALASTVDRPLLGPFLAQLVDSGRLVWTDDGGYLPA